MDVLSDLLRMDTKPIHTAGLELLIGADTEDVPAFPRIRMRERIRVPLWAYEFYRMVQGCLSLYTTGAVTAAYTVGNMQMIFFGEAVMFSVIQHGCPVLAPGRPTHSIFCYLVSSLKLK